MHASRSMISASYLVALETYAASRGQSLRLFDRANAIDRQQSGLMDAQISCAVLVELLEALTVESGDEVYALHFIESLPPRPAGVFHHIVCNSRTLRDAFQAFARFLLLVTDAFEIRYEEQDGIGWMNFDFSSCQAPRTQFVDGQLALIAVRARQLQSDQCRPFRVALERPPPQTAFGMAEFKRVFGITPQFGQPVNRIGFAISELARPLPSSNHGLYATAHDYAKTLMGLSEADKTFTTAVAKFIAGALARSEATEVRACSELNVSARTLQRNLSAEGTTFKALVEETRMNLARHYLIDTDLSLTAIAFLLGYSELSAFSRAAKMWHGASPSMYRKQHRAAPANST